MQKILLRIPVADAKRLSGLITWQTDAVEQRRSRNMLTKLARDLHKIFGNVCLAVHDQTDGTRVELVLTAQIDPDLELDLGCSAILAMENYVQQALTTLKELEKNKTIPSATLAIVAGDPRQSTDSTIFLPEPAAIIAKLLRDSLPAEGISIQQGDTGELHIKPSSGTSTPISDSETTHLTSQIYAICDHTRTAKIQIHQRMEVAGFPPELRRDLLEAQLEGFDTTLEIRSAYKLVNGTRRSQGGQIVAIIATHPAQTHLPM
jgi:hypothetical protein